MRSWYIVPERNAGIRVPRKLQHLGFACADDYFASNSGANAVYIVGSNSFDASHDYHNVGEHISSTYRRSMQQTLRT